LTEKGNKEGIDKESLVASIDTYEKDPNGQRGRKFIDEIKTQKL